MSKTGIVFLEVTDMAQYDARQYTELFHLLFLDQLGRKLDPNLYALKGDCNLRFFFNSIRYSEDIDLDIKIVRKETLHNKVENIFKSTPFTQILLARGIEIAGISSPKQTNTTQRWKISLQINNLTIPLNTKIEFSRRGLHDEVKFEAIKSEIIQQYHLSPIMINHYSNIAALQQKIKALASRSQIQARDIFDIYMLLATQGKIMTSDSKIHDFFAKAQENALAVSFQDYKSQVVSYLPVEYQTQYDSQTVWDNILLAVINILEDKN